MSILRFVLLAGLLACAAAHSWVDCLDWRFNVGKNNKWNDADGYCAGYTRYWPKDDNEPQNYWYKEHSLPRSSEHPQYTGLNTHKVCEDWGTISWTTSDRDSDVRANPVTAAYGPAKSDNGKTYGSMPVKKAGEMMCIRWPAKNHFLHVTDNKELQSYFGDTVRTNEVYVYLARTEAEPESNDAWRAGGANNPIKFTVPFINCPDDHPSGSDDLKPCGGCITIPSDHPSGIYSVMWEWTLGQTYNTGTYTSCGDVQITDGSGASPTPTSAAGASPTPTSAAGACDPSGWESMEIVCAACKALVAATAKYKTCDAYCAAQDGGLQCVGAWEDPAGDDMCDNPRNEVATCLTDFTVAYSTSDFICECAEGATAPTDELTKAVTSTTPKSVEHTARPDFMAQVKVQISVPTGKDDMTMEQLGEIQASILEYLELPSPAITDTTLLYDESTPTLSIIEFTLISVRDDRGTRTDPIAAARKLKAYTGTTGALAYMEVVEDMDTAPGTQPTGPAGNPGDGVSVGSPASTSLPLLGVVLCALVVEFSQ